MNIKNNIFRILGAIGGILLVPTIIWAINITVPSAPAGGFMLISTSTGAYIATTTDPLLAGSIIATSTKRSYFAGNVGIGSTTPAFNLGVTGTAGINGTTTLFINGIPKLGTTAGDTAGGLLAGGTACATCGAIWSNGVTPSATNYGFEVDTVNVSLNIPTSGARYIFFAQQGTSFLKFNNSEGMIPITDNSIGLGDSTHRWGEIYSPHVDAGASNLLLTADNNSTAFMTMNHSTGNVNVDQTFSVTGTATLSSTLSVTGKTTLGNATTTNISASNELNAPHSGTVPGLSAGDLYVNTNSTASSSVATSDGTTAHTLFAVHTVSTVLASSTLVYMGGFGASGTTTLPATQSIHSLTIRSFGCATDQGTAWLAFGTGTATTTAVQCAVGGKFISPASNNIFTGRQLIKMDVGTSASSPNTITVDVDVEDSN